jgi:hypothetical protein
MKQRHHFRAKLVVLLVAALSLASIVSAQDQPPSFVTFTPSPEATSETTADSTPTPIQLEPLLGNAPPPPIDITLPEGWRFDYDALVFNDLGELRVVPFAIYTGPITGGQGFIVIMWNFPNVAAGSAIAGTAEVDLYVDGLRLLRLVILETGCLVGTDLRTEYEIGGFVAPGTQFSAVKCPQTSDTAGWFMALPVDGMNFAFYMYSEPLDAMAGLGRRDLEDILDTVEFQVERYRIESTPEPESTPETNP